MFVLQQRTSNTIVLVNEKERRDEKSRYALAATVQE